MEPLSSLDILLHNRGTTFESELCLFIKIAIDFFVRGFEFSLADGALALDRIFSPQFSFAEIFHKVHSTSNGKSGTERLLLFDFKSKLSPIAGDGVYNTSTRQQSQVAFYIGFCAADPRYIELIPNYRQIPIITTFFANSPSVR